MFAPESNRLADQITTLLDRGYEAAVGAVLRAITASVNAGIVAQRLNELQAEAVRLDAAGQRLSRDNPVLRALTADLQPVLRRDSMRLDAGGGDAQLAGVNAAAQLTRGLTLAGVSDGQLRQIGIRWNIPSAESVNAAVGFVQSPAWAQAVDRYSGAVLETIQNQAIRGMVEGWNPLHTAREITRITRSFPTAAANNLMRTLQLTSYREATAIHQRANAAILVEQIRIAALDDRCCLACIALHGTRLPPGERVNDHHMGRCLSIAVIRGRPREVQTGEQWFNSLPEARRLAIAGPAAFDLLASGRARLRDFVQPYSDPIFGEMIRQASVESVGA